jgi:hypothetical protein
MLLQLIREQGNQDGLFEVGRRRPFHSFTPSSEKLSLAGRRRFFLARLIKVALRISGFDTDLRSVHGRSFEKTLANS